MKRAKGIFILLAVLCITIGLFACQAANDESANTTQSAADSLKSEIDGRLEEEFSTSDTKGNVLVAYFSATGNTKSIAEKSLSLPVRIYMKLYQLSRIQWRI